MNERTVSDMHASGIVNVSIDLGSRQMAFTIDGIIIPATDIFLERFVVDGEQFLSFSYSLDSVSKNGMIEKRRFFLPNPSMGSLSSIGELDKFGFASQIEYDDTKAKDDIVNFLSKDKNVK